MRPQQWVKNGILFFPLFFAQEIGKGDKLLHVFILFVGFCLLSSCIYILNDLLDIQEDRLHPTKRFRPLAAGEISPGKAFAFMLSLLGITTVYVRYFYPAPLLENRIVLLVVAYVLLNLLYSCLLKRIQIVDAMVIACGFVIRLEAGAEAGGIDLSHWLIIMTFILSLFLAFAKRLDDLRNFFATGVVSRKNITGYTIDFLNVVLAFLSAVITIVYILYTIAPEVTDRSSPYLYLTVPFVLTGIIRYLQILLVEQSTCNPTDILLHDRTLQLTIVGWLLVFTILIY